MTMPRVLRYFEKTDESYAGEKMLPALNISLLQNIFSISSADPMYDSYPVNEQQANDLHLLTSLDFDLDRFDYFLEYDEQ